MSITNKQRYLLNQWDNKDKYKLKQFMTTRPALQKSSSYTQWRKRCSLHPESTAKNTFQQRMDGKSSRKEFITENKQNPDTKKKENREQ